jgi:PKD repeat protein
VIDLNQELNAEILVEDFICSGSNLQLDANLEGNGITLLWSTDGQGILTGNNSRNPIYTPAQGESGSINFTLNINNQCGAKTFTAQTTIIPAPESRFTYDPQGLVYTGQEIDFTPINRNADGYNWEFGNGVTSNGMDNTLDFPEAGVYTVSLEVTDEGCSSSTEASIQITQPRNLYVPNVFHPAAINPENRVVKVYGEGLSGSDFLFRIYNRWGTVIYETNQLDLAQNSGWDGEAKGNGEMLSTNTFSYILKGQFQDGEKFEKTGTITLVK